MRKKNIYAGAFALVAVVLLLSAFTLAMDYEYRFLLDKTISIIAVCNMVGSVILFVLSLFWRRLKEAATKGYFIFYITTIIVSLIILFTPPTHIAVSIVFAIIIAINTTIIAQLIVNGAFRDEYEEN